MFGCSISKSCSSCFNNFHSTELAPQPLNLTVTISDDVEIFDKNRLSKMPITRVNASKIPKKLNSFLFITKVLANYTANKYLGLDFYECNIPILMGNVQYQLYKYF